MRPAPPLALLCPPSGAWRLACAVLAALASAAVAAWAAGHLEWQPGSMALAALAAAALGVFLGAGLAGPQLPAAVRWDGAHWHVDGQPGLLEVMLDLDRRLLLRLRPHLGRRGAVRWLVISRRTLQGDWPALRTALHAMAAASAPPETRPGAPALPAGDSVRRPN